MESFSSETVASFAPSRRADLALHWGRGAALAALAIAAFGVVPPMPTITG